MQLPGFGYSRRNLLGTVLLNAELLLLLSTFFEDQVPTYAGTFCWFLLGSKWLSGGRWRGGTLFLY